jgi:polyhydroxybutyrate depolymerase
MRYRLALVPLVLLLAAWVSALPTLARASTPYPPGLSDQTLIVNGVQRRFRIHVPAGVTTPVAAVFVLHGGGGSGMNVANTGAHPLSVFRTVADREGFVVVYPGGLPAANGDPGWNDCRGDNLNGSTADDVGFLSALIERVRGQYQLPTRRMFMAGGSNGGQMGFAFAFQQAESIAALATSAANLPQNPRAGACTTGPARPVPILMTHATADPQMPYLGGCVANLGGACSRGRVISAEATRDRWLQVNGLAAAASSSAVVEVATNDGGPARRVDHAGANPLQWWRLDGAGHTVASRAVLVPSGTDNGIQNRDIEFAEVAWAFFASRLPSTGSGALPRSAVYYDRARNGHGVAFGRGAGNQHYLSFYTYDAIGQPEWFLAAGPVVDGVFRPEPDAAGNTLLKYRFLAGQSPPSTIDLANSGHVRLDFNNAELAPACNDGMSRDRSSPLAVMTWSIGRDLNQRWCLEALLPPDDAFAATPDYSGLWGAAEPGWGLELMNYRAGGGPDLLFGVLFYPDAEGIGRWAMFDDPTPATPDTVSLLQRAGYCRTCPRPAGFTDTSVGSLRLTLTEPSTDRSAGNRADLEVSYRGAAGGRFVRNVPMALIVPPRQR